jgi:4-hydroxybenzoyl-CoA thioesterase/acyl-CoA thioester hydrolase
VSRTFTTTRRVEFRDTDAAGIAHFSAFFDFMESAEHEFLRGFSTSVFLRDADGALSWPRVSARCEFRGAVTFEDLVEIELSVSRLGEKSVSYAFAMRSGDRLVAEGGMTAVCCRIEPPAPPRSVPIPAAIAAAFREFVATPTP